MTDYSNNQIMKTRITVTFLLSWIILLPTHAQTVAGQDPLGVFHSISSHRILRDVEKQVSPEFAGRLTGTPGYNLAADWVAARFEALGLQPAGERGSYFQPFPVPYTLVYPGSEVILHLPVGKDTLYKSYHYFDEFVPGSTSGSGTITGEVVYVGYGVTAPELNYDDYAGMDVRGKILLMEREVPVSMRDSATFVSWVPYSFHQYKLKNAVSHGAAGMLYNYGPLANPNNAWDPHFIYSHVGDRVVQDLFAGTGRSYESTIASIREKRKPASFPTGKTVTITNHTEHFPEGTGYNILGYLPGEDENLRHEVIIIGAHLDHLGMCYDMMPGANDNASGVAVMLEVARALSDTSVHTGRSILFLAFGSEEQALLGSQHYLEHPYFPLEQTRCLVNLDGVGAGTKISATAGKNYPVLWNYFVKVNQTYLHQEVSANYFPNLGRPRLDAARFMWAGIPAVSFSAYGTPSSYHLPSDDLSTITPEIMEDLAQLIFLSVLHLSNDPSF